LFLHAVGPDVVNPFITKLTILDRYDARIDA